MFLSADKIHDGRKWLPEKSVLEIDDQGVILEIHFQKSFEHTQHFEGIICPGFVNTHCHVELSHLKGSIAEHSGLTTFLQQVMQQRNNFSEADKATARQSAVSELYQNGIVAIGDIANTTDTFLNRKESALHWHSFVESIGFLPDRANDNFAFAQQILKIFEEEKNTQYIRDQSIVPHAPYSVSEKLFQLIVAAQDHKTISIHNQETAAENLYYQNKSGDFLKFYQSIGIDDSLFVASQKTSLQTYGHWLNAAEPLILVHNTFSNKADIDFVEERFDNPYWCLCPNANIYIENRLPAIDALNEHAKHICIGTDSLASNHQLSILSELQTINSHFPHIGWETLLCWATYNGASALQMEDTIGSLSPNKAPGILWIKKDFSVARIDKK